MVEGASVFSASAWIAPPMSDSSAPYTSLCCWMRLTPAKESATTRRAEVPVLGRLHIGGRAGNLGLDAGFDFVWRGHLSSKRSARYSL